MINIPSWPSKSENEVAGDDDTDELSLPMDSCFCIGTYILLDSDKVEIDGGDNVSKFDSEMAIGESLPLAMDRIRGKLKRMGCHQCHY